MKIEREELKNLRDALVNLMDFIDVVEQGELPEFYRYFDTMKNNIEIFICIGCDDTEDIVPVLERIRMQILRCVCVLPGCSQMWENILCRSEEETGF